MNLEELIARGFLTELARVFGQGQRAHALLRAIGFPQELIPAGAPNDVAFWEIALQEIGHGIVVDGVVALIRQAHRTYPGNQLFRQLVEELGAADADQDQQSGTRTGSRAGTNTSSGRAAASSSTGAGAAANENAAPYGANITIQGPVDPSTLLDTAQRLAQRHSLGGAVALGIATEGWATLDLPGSTADQATRLANAIRQDLAQRGMEVRTITSAAQHRDYLISRLYVEGPDQARFELTDVPASTLVQDIAQSVASEYDPKVWKDDRGRPRATVVDHIHENGKAERLRPDTSLHENGIGEDATLHVAQEATAGVDMQDREAALVRVRNQVLAFRAANPDFWFSVNAQVPTEYVFRFQAPGWAPPEEPGGAPQPRDQHEVWLVLPPEFPVKAPDAFWQTPIFHPNIHPESGWVCLGDLTQRYRPGMDFGELCQILIDLARYQNYNVEPPQFHIAACKWAESLEGQLMIGARGGANVFVKARLEERETFPLTIKPLGRR